MGTTHLTCHIPEELKLQQHHCDSLKPHNRAMIRTCLKWRDQAPLSCCGVQNITLLDPYLTVPATNTVNQLVQIANACQQM